MTSLDRPDADSPEAEIGPLVRRTNAEWHAMLRTGKQPSRPEWTAGFLVSGVNPEVKNYGKVDKRRER